MKAAPKLLAEELEELTTVIDKKSEPEAISEKSFNFFETRSRVAPPPGFPLRQETYSRPQGQATSQPEVTVRQEVIAAPQQEVGLTAIMGQFIEQLKVNNDLPKPELIHFNGDSTEFCKFIHSFEITFVSEMQAFP